MRAYRSIPVVMKAPTVRDKIKNHPIDIINVDVDKLD